MTPVNKAIKKLGFLKHAVNYIFPAVVIPLKFFRRVSHSRNNTIAIISLNNLSDTVYSIPAIKAITEVSDNNICLVCYPETKPLFEFAVKNCKIITINHHDEIFRGKRITGISAIKKVIDIKAVTVIDLTGSKTSALLSQLSGAETIAGTNEKHFRILYDKFYPYDSSLHPEDIYMNAVKDYIDEDKREELKIFSASYDVNGYILIHPFAEWPAKEWGIGRYIELAVKLSSDYKCSFVAAPENLNIKQKDKLSSHDIEIINPGSVEELMDVIDSCSVFIGNDASPVYVAGMMGKPTFTIFGPTNPAFHILPGEHHTFIRKQIGCSPEADKKYCNTDAGRDGCSFFECMSKLSVDEVYLQFTKFLHEFEIEKKK